MIHTVRNNFVTVTGSEIISKPLCLILQLSHKDRWKKWILVFNFLLLKHATDPIQPIRHFSKNNNRVSYYLQEVACIWFLKICALINVRSGFIGSIGKYRKKDFYIESAHFLPIFWFIRLACAWYFCFFLASCGLPINLCCIVLNQHWPIYIWPRKENFHFYE